MWSKLQSLYNPQDLGVVGLRSTETLKEHPERLYEGA